MTGPNKKVNFAIWTFSKKSQFRQNFVRVADPDPSLGLMGQTFIMLPKIGSIWSGLPGIPSWARRPKLPVWASNSRLRVARTNLIVDSESTQKLGSGKASPGPLGYF